MSEGCWEGRGRGAPAAAAPLFRGVRTKEWRGRAGPGGAAAGAVPGAGGGDRLRGSVPRGERPPAGRAWKESGDPDRAGRGCEKGCEAGRPCVPAPIGSTGA